MSDEQTGGDVTATGLHAQSDYPRGTVLAGRFRIEAILGIGGMGVVYRATDMDLDVPVALKLLRPELAHRADAFERFRQELLLARQVSSAHVVRIHDLARHDGRWLISMDYVDGESLDHRLDLEGPLPIEDALRIARQMAEGLAAAHAKGVVHRDLKPANILLDAQGDAYISDFGVARSLATSGQTRTGSIVGTPDYLAPEQARGDPADARSDLYALGLILYEMLTGRSPFAGGTVAEVLAQRMLRTPAPVSRERAEVPAWIVRLVDRLLRSRPAHRFQSAGEVVAAIDRRAVPRRLYADVIRRHAVMSISVLTALVLAAGIAGWWRLQPHVPVLVDSPPLDRVLVLPIVAAGMPATRAAALSAHLRDALAGVSGYAVVDGERTAQVLRQLDADNRGHVDTKVLGRVAVAKRVLQPTLVESHGRWQVHAQLDVAGGRASVFDGPQAADAIAALQKWMVDPVTQQTLGLQGKSPTLALPQSVDALDHYGAGILARQDNRLADALQQFTLATSVSPGDPAAWLAQADTALMIGEQDKAADAIEQGQRAAASAPDRLLRRFTALRAATDGDFPAAVAQWRLLAGLAPDDTDAQLNLARARGAGGDYAAAVTALKALSQRDGNDPRVWFELGKFSILSGDAQHAVDDDLVRALVQFKRGRNLYGEAETVNALGIGYGRLGQTEDAAEQYRKAVTLRHAVGNVRGEATSLRNLGNALSLTGKFDEAAADLEKARALHAQLGDRAGLAAVENELGLLAEERGDFNAALQAFQRAYKAWQDVDDPLGSAQALNDIGFAQFELGDYNDAQVYLQQASTAYDTLGDQTGRIRVEQDLGLLDLARGRWTSARRRLQHALDSAQQQQMAEEAAVSHRHLAELELQQGHLKAAIDQATRAEDSFRRRDDPRGQSDAGLLRVDALLAAHADDDASHALAALQPAIARSSTEQRATAQLLQAELARDAGDRVKAAFALRSARQLATGSGIRQLQLRIDLLAARMSGALDPALDAATASLGHADLRLQWLQLAMTRASSTHDPARASKLYNEAVNWLRAGESIRAADLHTLGATARAATGDQAGAQAALARANDARTALRAQLPQAPQAHTGLAGHAGTTSP
jgi:tetratricopeptide (TPR) repeat protein